MYQIGIIVKTQNLLFDQNDSPQPQYKSKLISTSISISILKVFGFFNSKLKC